MIVYKDMVFCSFYSQCANGETCGRKLAQEIQDDAKECGLAICQYLGKPECHIDIKEKIGT